MRIDIAFFSIAFRIGVGLVLGIATGIATLGTLAATLSALDESRRALLRDESAEVAELTQRKATA